MKPTLEMKRLMEMINAWTSNDDYEVNSFTSQLFDQGNNIEKTNRLTIKVRRGTSMCVEVTETLQKFDNDGEKDGEARSESPA
jgi:hypothetical protein